MSVAAGGRGAPGLAAAGVVVLGLLAPASAAAGDGRLGLAERLMRLDPGANRGANTHVATEPRVRVFGVPRRTNFIVGLGPGQRLVGGGERDELGVRGVAGRIFGAGGRDLIHGHYRRDRLYGGPGTDLISGHAGRDLIRGGPGRDLIYGGPGRDRLRGGPGRDRLIDGNGRTAVRAAGDGDRVDVADGRGDDSVRCAAGAVVRLAADRGDRIYPACQARLARAAHRQRDVDPPARAAQSQIRGSGTNEDPYTTTTLSCAPAPAEWCTVAFPPQPPGGFGGFWSNGYVPAYKCPGDAAGFLRAKRYAPFGTSVPQGVEIQGLGPIGVAILGVSYTSVRYNGRNLVNGITTGGVNSSATNWNGPGRTYSVVLHCTTRPEQGYGEQRYYW